LRAYLSRTAVSLALSLSVLTLTTCGGGGGGSSSPSPVAPVAKAEGVYSGSLTGSTSSAFQLLVLENDEYWGLYGTSSTSAFFVAGFLQGQGTSSNGSFTSSSLKDFGTVPPANGSVAATYVANTSINGSVTAPGGSVAFSGTPITSSSYNYNTPADLSAVVGNWNLTALDRSSVILSVASDGRLTGSTGGCVFGGTFTPRPSGKNVFNISLTFGPAPCTLANQTGAGVALSYLLSGGTIRQLIVAGVDGARTTGTALFGTR
jgi:hypothetical protein